MHLILEREKTAACSTLLENRQDITTAALRMVGISQHRRNKPTHIASEGISPRKKELGREVVWTACALAHRDIES